ncbi:MAG TPA: ABC transporter permease, partial [Solirubrobacteraceae bacterium]|nr:ABC transporter permease [Solirubrobacteraceae bacterium]
KEIERVLGLDKSLPVQFWDYLKGVFFHGNFGYSYYSREAVTELIKERLPATASLAIGAAVIWIVAGLGIGVIAALRPRTWIDRTSMGGALVLISAPEFWLGLIALLLFASDIGKFKLFPGSGSYVGLTDDPWKWFTSLILPWCVLAAGSAAVFARLMRGSMIETMKEDYIRTARAKGLPERKVIRQGVRASINPIVTLLALEVGVLLGGTVLVEYVFNIPGIGRLAYTSIVQSDFEVVQGTVLLAAMFIIVANIVADIGYAYLDPRVRYS